VNGNQWSSDLSRKSTKRINTFHGKFSKLGNAETAGRNN
jgi:hypothetical protein